MAKRLPYIHETWFIDSGEPFPGSPIRGKAHFNEVLTDYFFNGDDPKRVAFRLVGSPNTTVYEVHPYINRMGNPSIVFTKQKNDTEGGSVPDLLA